ncbi:MAG: cysteine desulfurase family protein, partial [Patescibacteria group bacterium]
TAKDLEKDGAEIVYIPVDKRGIVDPEKIESFLNERTILVSIMYVNNEVGAIEPLAEISRVIKNFSDKPYAGSFFPYPLFHTDAAQAFQFLDCDVKKLGVDLMTFSSHKIYGPKGIGALYIGKNVIAGRGISPIITGGGQEFGLRSGTENIPLIAGFARALDITVSLRKKESERLMGIKDYFWSRLKEIYPKARMNGPEGREGNSPAIINVYFPDWPAEELISRLDMEGIAASSGSACRTRTAEPSYVIEAMGYDSERARKSIRFSFGRPTTKKEIDLAIRRIRIILEDRRK